MPVIPYEDGASPCGAQLMLGNVFEWVADWYDPSFYETGSLTDPLQADESSQLRVTRGDGWDQVRHLSNIELPQLSRRVSAEYFSSSDLV